MRSWCLNQVRKEQPEGWKNSVPWGAGAEAGGGEGKKKVGHGGWSLTGQLLTLSLSWTS